jgi:hypothetical protein
MFFIYGGICINVQNYHLIEEAFKDLCKDILKIDNIYNKEIHAGNIFKRNKGFENLSENDVILYFDEVLQLLSKFNIPLIVGIAYKEAKIFGDLSIIENKIKLLASAIYSFLTSADYFLSQENSRGLIIADEITEKRYKNIEYLKDLRNLYGKNGGIKIDLLMNRIFFERLKRFNEDEIEPIIKLKYKFESKIYSILDNIHFVRSNLSPFTQLADTILFLLNIYFEYFFFKAINKLDIYQTEERYKKKYKLIENLNSSMDFFLNHKNIFSRLYELEKEIFDTFLREIDNLTYLEEFIKEEIRSEQ